MIDPATSRKWLYRLLFAGLAAGLLFLQVLPLSTAPSRLPGPDLLLCLTFAWVQRRPDFVPPLLLVAVFLSADLLLMRPPGLWSVLVLLAAEFLRSRHHASAEVPFAIELMFTTSAIVAVSLANIAILNLTAVAHAGLAMYMMQMLMTIIFYPPVVLLSRVAFDLRRLSPAELETQRSAR